MGRGKVQLKRIEDKKSRQVTFSKRRSGLMKKAMELSVLCDVDVALFIFSGKGKMYEYSSESSLKRILERHQSRFEAKDTLRKDTREKPHEEDYDLPDSINLLPLIQRSLDANTANPLNISELTQLEQHLESLIRHTRIKTEQVMRESVLAMDEKERHSKEGMKNGQTDETGASSSFPDSPPSAQLVPPDAAHYSNAAQSPPRTGDHF
ncbi:hypothetical protein QQ045_008215 [Rhodiola kirilowii]